MSIFDKAELAAKVRKLPKWAQQEIANLNMRVREAREELRSLNEGARPGSDCYYRSYSYEGTLPERVELPHGMLTVVLGKDKWGRDHEITVSKGRANIGVPAVEIRSTHGPLRIIPQVSNAVHITTLNPTEDD